MELEVLVKIYASQFEPESYMPFEQPLANYGAWQYDTVLDAGDNNVGVALYTGYSENEKRGLSLAAVDPHVEVGTEIRIVWGETSLGLFLPRVSRHWLGDRRIALPSRGNYVPRRTALGPH